MTLLRTRDSIQLAGRVFLDRPDPGLAVAPDATGSGAFLVAQGSQSGTRLTWKLGIISGVRRFLACARDGAWWMVPRTGTALAQVPVETQFLLLDLEDGEQVLIVPLVDELMRFTVEGSADGLVLVGETGDAFHGAGGGLAAYIARGSDPYQLAEQGARAVAARLPGCRLRTAKPLPDFIDRFGWCTWDAFYHAVDPSGIRAGLTSLRAAGATVGFLIIDDGWQSTARQASGEESLTSFRANAKFAHSLTPTVRMAKEEFGVATVMVWHNIVGYWGGIDPGALPGYDAQAVPRSFGQGLLQVQPQANHQFWGQLVTRPSAAGIRRFYDDYHGLLAKEGVDGVKVDSQAVLEGVANGAGGRVALTASYRAALEDSVHRHFHGRLINCMSHGSETWYLPSASNLNRGSNDFWPNDPATHGQHLWTNAAVGLWFGAFQQIDWDMFHSQHAMGWFHAAARAVSGGPVYVSDKPGAHDPAVLRAVAMSGGRVPRALDAGRPGRSSLYGGTPLLTVVNRNRHGDVVGVFHREQTGSPVTATIGGDELPTSPDDTSPDDTSPDDIAAYGFRSRQVARGGLVLTLAPQEWEVVTLSPITEGLAIFGLAQLLNPGGAIDHISWHDGLCTIDLGDGGELVGWAERKPTVVDGAPASGLQWSANNGGFVLAVPGNGPRRVVLRRS
jgi:raffinose synthase